MSSTSPSVTSVPGGTRIAALDVLRGVAILGTFASNVWFLALPAGAASALLGDGLTADGLGDAGLLAVSNGKFLALLTLLFGVGLTIQHRSATRRGRPWPGRYPVRAAVLFAEGLVHYVLVFEFDVLMGYAVTSLLVAYLVGRSDRVIRAWIWTVGSVFTLLILAVTALVLVAPTPAPTAGPPIDTTSWTAQVVTRLLLFPLFRSEILLIVPVATVLFLVGSRLLRAGAFDATPGGARIQRRLMVWGLGVGVPVNVIVAVWGGDAFFLVERYLVGPVVALGLLGLVTMLVHRVRAGVVQHGLAAIGRTALSCYVLQNVLAAAVCYQWGLGLAVPLADARPGWVLGLWAGVSLACTAFAVLWLRRFDRGPLELLADRVKR